MDSTDGLFSEGRLESLEGCSRTLEGVNRTMYVTQGRFSKTMSMVESVSGHEELAIISSHTELEN